MAVELQFGLCMIAFTSVVTYACPAETSPGGCSLTFPVGAIQDTDGSVPLRAALKKLRSDVMLSSCQFSRTVSNQGSGFQIPGVFASCGIALHTMAESSSQSGSVPLNT